MSDRLPVRRLTASALVACCALVCLSVPRFAFAQLGEEGPIRFDISGIEVEPAAAEPAVEMRLSPETVRPGDEVTFSVTVHVPAGAHTYSINPKLIGATQINVKVATGLEPLGEGFQADHEPKEFYEPAFEANVEKHTRDVTWTRKYRVAANASGRVQLTGKVRYQICDASTCTPFNEPIDVSAAVATSGEARSAVPAGTTAREAKFEHSERPMLNDQPGPAEVRATLTPAAARPGERVKLAVTITLDEGWHTYAIWEKRILGAAPTKIEVAALRGLKPLTEAFSADRPPERKTVEEVDDVFEIYHDRVTWTRDFEVVDPQYGLAGTITYQVCDKNRCLPARPIEFGLGDAPVVAALPPDAVHSPRDPANAQATESDRSAPAADDGDDASATTSVETPKALIPFVLAAIGFGLASLFTPCVFPMVPITVSFFLKQSEKAHHRPVLMALVYCGTIVLTFAGIGVVVAALYKATDLNRFANGPWLNVFIAGVLIFFGLNLLGLFELRAPGWMLNWTAGKEARGGYFGTVFMALTFTLVSFTCTFAFVGFLLAMASKGEVFWPIVGMLAFSAAFALPFFFLALFPSMLQRLPKSGGWMNRVKVTMAMIELGAAFKFLSVADLAWNPVATIFDYSMVLTGWLVISACTGIYLLGLFRLSHDTPSEDISVPRFVVAMSFLGFSAYLAAGLFAPEKPGGALWDLVYSQLPPRYQAAGREENLGPYLEEGGLKYALDYEQGLEHAKHTSQPVFIDFTGENCSNCRLMEKRMQQPQLHERLARFVRIKVYADSVPTYTDPEESILLEKNRQLQQEWFGDVTLPSYVIVTPDRKVLTRHTGQTDVGTFTRFLDEGLTKWERVVAGETPVGDRTAARAADPPGISISGISFRSVSVSDLLSRAPAQLPKLLYFSGRSGSPYEHFLSAVFRTPEIRAALEEFDRIEVRLDDAAGLRETQEARELQSAHFNDGRLPAFLVVSPDGSNVLAKYIGIERDGLLSFLQAGLDAHRMHPGAAVRTADLD